MLITQHSAQKPYSRPGQTLATNTAGLGHCLGRRASSHRNGVKAGKSPLSRRGLVTGESLTIGGYLGTVDVAKATRGVPLSPLTSRHRSRQPALGSCRDSPSAIAVPAPHDAADRYFFPEERDSLEAHFGRAICRRCPEIAGCWDDVLKNPPVEGVRAGQDTEAIQRIRQRMIDATGQASVDDLPDELLYPDYEPLWVRHLKTPAIRHFRLVPDNEQW